MEAFERAWSVLKEEGQRRTLRSKNMANFPNAMMTFGENITDAQSFVVSPLNSVRGWKSDGKERIGPNLPMPQSEEDWHQVAHAPFIDGYEPEGYEAFNSESDALQFLMNIDPDIPFADDGFYHPNLHAFDVDNDEWVTHLGEGAPSEGDAERVFRAKVMQDGGVYVSHNPVYPDWVWTKIKREQDEGGNHHLTLYTGKYPYSLDRLHEQLQEDVTPFVESGAIQFPSDE
tara:strand:+ start:2514 stop:3203 length:690 start_codon:yes stop_codon:yes gene_type:complete